MSEAPADPGPETVYLGRFDPLKIPIILEVLAEHDIFALSKSPVGEGQHDQYTFLNEGRRIVLVDREKIAEAKALVDSEVAERLAEMSTLLGEPGPTAEDVGLVPFGFFAPGVARVFLELLEESGIGAEPEYPLEQPAPVYARADGRVRVHVEELFLADAEEMLKAELPEELERQGIAFVHPLRDNEEP